MKWDIAAPDLFSPLNSPRYEGFVDTFTEAGGECPEKFIWRPAFDHAGIEDFICQNADDENLPSLFYCFADNIMFPVIRGFTAAGLKVPEDISLIGAGQFVLG